MGQSHAWIKNTAFTKLTGIKKVCMMCGAPSNNAPKECPGERVKKGAP